MLGLVKIDSIVTDLTATATASGAPTFTGGTIITGASVAGQPVTIDADGIHQAADPPSSTTPVNGIFGGLVGGLTGNLNDVLTKAGIHITMAGPVQQSGADGGQLGSDGLRIDVAFSDETVPGLTALLKGLPPLPNPIPGAPSPEDLVQLAKANNLVSIELARGVVTLATRSPFKATVTPRAPTGAGSAANLGSASSPIAAGPARSNTAPAVTGSAGVIVPASTDGDPATPIGAGVGALALLVLLAQPFVGDWLGRGSAALLRSEQATACPWEER